MARSKAQGRQRKHQKRDDHRVSPVTPASRFTDLMTVHSELSDELFTFLDPRTIIELCTALWFNKRTRAVLKDSRRWRILLMLHCGVDAISNAKAEAIPTTGNTVDTSGTASHGLDHCDNALHSVVPTLQTVGCRALVEYVSLRSQLQHLRENISVVEGDIGTITTISGSEVDCLVFPTSGCFRNPRVGAANAVHARAGPELDKWVAYQQIDMQWRPHSDRVLCSPGFDANVDLLVHCAGPAHGSDQCEALLYATYKSALDAIASSDKRVECAAVASISTGRLHFPLDRAAAIALQAVCDTIFERDFTTKLAFVCIDARVRHAFALAKHQMLQTVLVSRGINGSSAGPVPV